MIDTNPSIQPPSGLSIPYTEQLIVTTVTLIPLLYNLYIGFRNLSRGDSTCLLFAIGGLISAIFEPLIDNLGFCFFPREGSWIAFEWLGRPIPQFVAPTYGWFVGGQGYWFLTILRDPKTTRADVWKLWLKSFTANILLEYPAICLRVYVYYGYHPFMLAGMPLWFFAIHSIAPMISSVIIYLIEKEHLTGWKKLFIPSIVVSTYGMSNAGFGWPVWIALDAHKGYHVTYPAAVLEFTLIAIAIWIITLAIPEEKSSTKMSTKKK